MVVVGDKRRTETDPTSHFVTRDGRQPHSKSFVRQLYAQIIIPVLDKEIYKFIQFNIPFGSQKSVKNSIFNISICLFLLSDVRARLGLKAPA